MRTNKILALALAFVLVLSTGVFAAIPNNTLIVGNKAFDIPGYVAKPEHVAEIQQAVDQANGKIYYQLDGVQDTWAGVFGGSVSAEELDALGPITYKGADGKEVVYEKFSGNPVTEEPQAQEFDLEVTIDDPDMTLVADGADNAIITVRAKRYGEFDPSFRGTVRFVSLQGAQFGKELVSFDKGVAQVQLTSTSSATPVQDTIYAIIKDVEDAQDSALVGFTKSLNVMYVPEAGGGEVADKVFIAYAESDRASDVFVRFNKKFDFAALYKDWKANGVIKVKRYGDAVPVAVDDIVKVDDTTVKLVLLEEHALVDNSAVTVYAYSSGVNGALIDSSFTFNLVDPKAPEALDVDVRDYRTIEAIFTEPVVSDVAEVAGNWVLNGHRLSDGDVEFIKVGRAGDEVDVVEENDVQAYVPDPVSPRDNRNVVTIKLSADASKNYLKDEGKANLLQAYNIIDYAGLRDTTGQNKATTQEFTFVTPALPAAPTAEVKMDSPEQFRVVFSTEVEPLTSKNFRFEYQNGVDEESGEPVWTEVPLEDDVTNATYAVVTPLSAREYLIELEQDWTQEEKLNTAGTRNNYYTPGYNVVRITVLEGVKNLLGVAMTEDDVNTVTMKLDATSPTIKSAGQLFDEDGNPLQEFRVVMSEPVQVYLTENDPRNSRPLTPSQKQEAGTGIPTPTFQFVKADGSKTVDGVLSEEGIDETDTEFVVVPESDLEPGEWTLYIRSISDDVGNTSATVSYPLVVAAEPGVTGEPKIIWADAHDHQPVGANVYADLVHIQFGTIMSLDALKSTVYTINGKPLGIEAMITSQDVEYDAGNLRGVMGTRVRIQLPDSFLDKDSPNVLNVSKSLKDAEGNLIKAPTEVVLPYPDATEVPDHEE